MACLGAQIGLSPTWLLGRIMAKRERNLGLAASEATAGTEMGRPVIQVIGRQLGFLPGGSLGRWRWCQEQSQMGL